MLWFSTSAARRALTVLAFATIVSHPNSFAQKRNPDYSLGRPRLWIYQRVYPFLDGIFQDVSSTAVAPLTLISNGANASQLNALQTSWGAGVNFSSTTQAQNALAQQQNQLMIANTQLQSQLLTQESQINQQLLTATQQQGQAQNALAQLTTSQANPDQTQLAAAQAAVTSANSNVNSLTAQLALVKAQIPTTAPTFSAPSASQPSTVTLPSQISGATAPPSAPSTPNFPVSKQMDNQVNLLWERLSRLVSTLAQADSLHDYHLVLAGFDVNLMPNREDKKVFAVEYTATAFHEEEGKPESSCAMTPLVVDMFPSASAVNIVNNQYKDTRGAIGVALSWLGFGINAAYNRDHLQMTQALGQSAYITGYGAGTNTFGWAFGRNLGDKSVSPGKRTVFAIIAVPNGCQDVQVQSNRAGWFGETSDTWYSRDSNVQKRFQISIPTSIKGPVEGGNEIPKITTVAYTPTEFDPSATTPTITSLRVDFGTDIDPEMEISVNGQIVPRARDTFARAVQNAGGSGGMLESSSFTVNTWIATSSHSATISVDPSKFARDFPDVVFITPKKIQALNEAALLPRFNRDGVLNLDDKGTKREFVEYAVAGARFGCGDPCRSNIPPLGFRKAAWQALSAFHRDPDPTDKTDTTTFVLSMPSDVSNTSAFAPATGNVQVLAAAPSPWGGNVLVTASLQGEAEGTPQLIRLTCHPVGGTVRLICTFPPALISSLNSSVTIEVHDGDHAGGSPVSARATLERHSANEPFIVWSLSQPRWVTGDSKGNSVPALLLCAAFMNAKSSDRFALGLANGTPGSGSDLQFNTSETNCHKEQGQWTGGVRLTRDEYMTLTDQMTIVHEDSSGAVIDTPATLLNLHAAGEPLIYTTSTDGLELYGQNLVFGTQLQIGSGNPIPAACDTLGSSCQVNPPLPPPNVKPAPAPLGSQGGPVYMVYTNQDKHSILIPVMKNTNGVVAAFQYVPPTATGGGSSGNSGGGNGQASFSMTISGNSSGGANPPVQAQQQAAGGTPSGSAVIPPTTTPAANPPATPGPKSPGISPMSVIVSQ